MSVQIEVYRNEFQLLLPSGDWKVLDLDYEDLETMAEEMGLVGESHSYGVDCSGNIIDMDGFTYFSDLDVEDQERVATALYNKTTK